MKAPAAKAVVRKAVAKKAPASKAVAARPGLTKVAPSKAAAANKAASNKAGATKATGAKAAPGKTKAGKEVKKLSEERTSAPAAAPSRATKAPAGKASTASKPTAPSKASTATKGSTASKASTGVKANTRVKAAAASAAGASKAKPAPAGPPRQAKAGHPPAHTPVAAKAEKRPGTPPEETVAAASRAKAEQGMGNVGGPSRAEKAAAQSAVAVKEPDEAHELFLAHQRELLVAERNNYTRQAEELRAQAEALALEHEPGDVQFDEEGGEGGTANVDRELDLHLSAQAHAAIEEIDAALGKIDAGTYGLCEICGNPIPKARLEALPHARLCVTCKSGGLTARRQ